MKDEQLHRYKLALYGASGSGKTVFLAALAMSRVIYHPDFTITRLPLTGAAKQQEKELSEQERARMRRLKLAMNGWSKLLITCLANRCLRQTRRITRT